MHILNVYEELSFFLQKMERFFKIFHIFEFKKKMLKKQGNFTARKHHDFRRFSENDLLKEIARIFSIFEMCVSIRV